MENIGETASFSCEYSQNHINDPKIIFKEEKDSIEMIYSKWKKKERLSISDDKHKNIFSVRMTAVTPDDGGVYLCGVWVYSYPYSYSIINTVHLHITSKVGVSRVSSSSGGRLMIKCEHPQYKTNPKYICKESDGCSERKNPGVQGEWMENGDVSLYDDTRAGVLMVFFRELKAADEGTYRCGVKVSDYTESFTEIQLSIRHDAKYPKNVTESVYPGGEVNIICRIPNEHKVHFCKEDDNHICQSISSSKVTEMSGSSERNEERVVTVSISNVSVRDAGVYWCGAETRDTDLTFISLNTQIQLHLITKVGVSRVNGSSGGRLMIKCEHPQYKTNPKYICKESDGCSERKNPGVQGEWMENGDVSLYDDTRAGVLMVFFRELKAADEGTYRCGVKVSDYTESFNEIQLSVRDDEKYPKSVTESAHIGKEVNFTCQILEKHKVQFCKEDDNHTYNHICQSISSSKVTEMSGSSERNEERVVTVSISNVSVRDAGVYWCGAETRDTHLTFISLNTQIQLNLIMPPVVRHEGESAEIICPYDSIYKSKPKSLCKGKCSIRDRNPLSETVREEKETKTGRLTLNDDITAGVFTGSITGLTAEDAGKYWCAVTLETELNYLYTHLIVIMNEELNLTKYEGDDVSIQCKHHDEDQKRFCKAHEASMCVKDGVSLETIRDDRISFSDEASTGVFTVNITDLREEDSGIYWCGAHIITKVNLEVNKSVTGRITISCVSVTLLLMGASVLLLYKLGYIKTRDQHTSPDRTGMSGGEASHAACDYENIKDARSRSIPDTEETALYSTVTHPTDVSDPNDMLYSTVQLPTNPSDGLLYASVHFQKHEQSISDAKVTFNNEDVYCNYTTVSLN
ncbi:polymeric immunoglobulin receptor-like [Carassius carassius]|uniref:polymeric immunoglobulin receptor-like n=1 Tax=Carassius carassius TaxID=217509 RepID=UPI0028689349|nr:polymeric immunoglobulin receptor-like [Carassius carassius]